MRIAFVLRVGLPWLTFFSSFFLVLVLPPPLLYFVWGLTALGIFYIGFEGRRLKCASGPVRPHARSIIEIGFILVSAGAFLSLLVDLMVLDSTVLPIGLIRLAVEFPWILGTIVAYGGILYARTVSKSK